MQYNIILLDIIVCYACTLIIGLAPTDIKDHNIIVLCSEPNIIIKFLWGTCIMNEFGTFLVSIVKLIDDYINSHDIIPRGEKP